MLTGDELRRAFPNGDVGEPVVLDGGSDGSTFLLDRGRQRFVLRRWAHKPLDEIVHEASLLRYLSSRGYPSPPPFSSVFVDADGTVNAVRPFVEGTVPVDLREEEVGEIGRMLGRLHQLTRSVAFEGAIDRYRLDDSSFLADLERSRPELASGLALLRERLAEVDFSGLATGVVHDDVKPENIVRIADGALVLIDWSDAHFDFSVADLGAAVAQLRLDASGIRSLLIGYREVAELGEYEASLIDLVALRRVAFLVWYYEGLADQTACAKGTRVPGDLLERARAGLQALTYNRFGDRAC